MIIYSVTINIEQQIESDWLKWMQEKHIPEVMATGYFLDYVIQRMLDPQPQEGTITYNIQYSCRSLELLEEYQAHQAPDLQAQHNQRYEGRFVAFRTLLHRLET